MCFIAAPAAATAATSAAVTAANVSIAASLAGLALSTVGMFQQSQAQKKQAGFRARVAENNRIIAERQAEDTLERGDIEAKRHREKVRLLIGRQQAVLSSSGFSFAEGDEADILADTAGIGEVEAQTIENNAERDAFQFRVEAANAGAQSTAFRSEADAINPLLSAGSALFSGIGSVADKWYKARRTFA